MPLSGSARRSLAANVLLSALTIFVYRRAPSLRLRALPPYPSPETRPSPSLVLGETHFRAMSGRAPDPEWLVVPQRGLYTGVMILGAVGTGKTSACMYPYVEQLLRWRAQDPAHKVGGLVLEVKGDFCKQVRGILRDAGRGDDYLEIGLDTGVCYNPLHNDLDPYAVAYAVATLLNNLFGRSKEPFWQQAYTDLLKFVISLRRISDGYTTLSEVYRYIINESQIDHNIRALQAQFRDPPEVTRRLPRRLPARRPAGAMDAVGAARIGLDGPPVRRRSRGVSVRARHSLRGAQGHRRDLRESPPPTRSDPSLVLRTVDEARSAGESVHRRGCRGLFVALRREPGSLSRLLSAAAGVRAATPARGAASASPAG